MSTDTKDIAELPNEKVIQKLADAFPEEAKKEIILQVFLAMNTKWIADKDSEEKRRRMTVFEAFNYVLVCRDLKLSPLLKEIQFVDGDIYITLDGYKKNASNHPWYMGMSVELISAEDVEVEVKKWVDSANGQRGKYEFSTKITKRYTYKATVRKKVGDEVIEFYGEGIADVSNVTGGEKNTDLKIRQMAEARAKRRALSDAFPCGLSSYEDSQEMPDFNVGHTPYAEVDPVEEPAREEPPAPSQAKEEAPKKEKESIVDQIIGTIRMRVPNDTDEEMEKYLADNNLPALAEIRSMDEDKARDISLKLFSI